MNDYSISELSEVSPQNTEEISNLLKQHVPHAPMISMEHLGKVVNSPTSFIFVAVDHKDKIIGMATLLHTPKLDKLYKTEIEDVVVDTVERGKGVGSALITKALEKAKALGATTVSLTSNPTRVAANHLYKKLGFTLHQTNNYKMNLA